MCIAIYVPHDKEIPIGYIDQALENHKHGWGLVATYPSGELVVERGFGPRKAKQAFREHAGVNRVFHARHCTVGKPDLANTHPYDVTYEEDPRWFFHNGTLKDMPLTNPDMSDSWHFAQLIRNTPTSDELLKNIQQFCLKEGSRFALVTRAHVHRFGTWIHRDGSFFSNDTAWKKVDREKKDYMSQQEFDERWQAYMADPKKNKPLYKVEWNPGKGNNFFTTDDPRNWVKGGEHWFLFPDGVIRCCDPDRDECKKNRETWDRISLHRKTHLPTHMMADVEIDKFLREGELPSDYAASNSPTLREVEKNLEQLRITPGNETLMHSIVQGFSMLGFLQTGEHWTVQEKANLMANIRSTVKAHVAGKEKPNKTPGTQPLAEK